jgi:hypothetical protein
VLSQDEFDTFKRIADALGRLADKFAPIEKREHKAAVIGTAAYSEEERERLRLKDELKRKAQKSA